MAWNQKLDEISSQVGKNFSQKGRLTTLIFLKFWTKGILIRKNAVFFKFAYLAENQRDK